MIRVSIFYSIEGSNLYVVQEEAGVKGVVVGVCDTYAERGCDKFVSAAGCVLVLATVP